MVPLGEPCSRAGTHSSQPDRRTASPLGTRRGCQPFRARPALFASLQGQQQQSLGEALQLETLPACSGQLDAVQPFKKKNQELGPDFGEAARGWRGSVGEEMKPEMFVGCAVGGLYKWMQGGSRQFKSRSWPLAPLLSVTKRFLTL